MDRWEAPFTEAQIDALNAWQQNGKNHPYTCGSPTHRYPTPLIATTPGWACTEAGCEYKQTWAHPIPAAISKLQAPRMSHRLTLGQTVGYAIRHWMSDPHHTCTMRDYGPDEKNPCRCCCIGCETSCTAHWELEKHDCLLDKPEPVRVWRYEQWDTPWWRPVILDGIRGGDEWCNRTVGIKWGKGAWMLNLNVPMRREPCNECKKDATDTPESCLNPYCAKPWSHKGDCTDMQIDDALLEIKLNAPEAYEKLRKILEL